MPNPKNRTIVSVVQASRPSAKSLSDLAWLYTPAELPPCWCTAPSEALVQGRVVGGLAIVAVPVCDAHIPKDHARAERVIAATLLAIADAVKAADIKVQGRGRRRVRRG